MNYLIDTNIIIYSLKNEANVQTNFKRKGNIPKSISAITYGELIYGAKKSQYVEKNIAIVRRIAEIFPIISITASIMDAFGEIKANLESKGNVIGDMDLLIASTAITNNMILVTNNEKHFKSIHGLEIENWKNL